MLSHASCSHITKAVPNGAGNITLRFSLDSRYRPELYGGNSCLNETQYNCSLCTKGSESKLEDLTTGCSPTCKLRSLGGCRICVIFLASKASPGEHCCAQLHRICLSLSVTFRLSLHCPLAKPSVRDMLKMETRIMSMLACFVHTFIYVLTFSQYRFAMKTCCLASKMNNIHSLPLIEKHIKTPHVENVLFLVRMQAQSLNHSLDQWWQKKSDQQQTTIRVLQVAWRNPRNLRAGALWTQHRGSIYLVLIATR